MTKEVTTNTAKEELLELIDRAQEGERIVLYRDGKPVAAIVPPEDATFMDQLEDQLDIEAAREALKEPGTVPWEQIKKEFGL